MVSTPFFPPEVHEFSVTTLQTLKHQPFSQNSGFLRISQNLIKKSEELKKSENLKKVRIKVRIKKGGIKKVRIKKV